MSQMFAGSRMSTYFPRLRWLAGVGHGLAYVLGGGVAVVLGLAIIGFPHFLTRWILAGANSGDYYIQAHDVYLDLAGGVNARDVSVYRKGIPGPPFLETRELRVLYHLFERPRAGRTRIKELKAYDGILRPLWSSAGFGLKQNVGAAGPWSAGSLGNGTLKWFDLDVSLFNFEVLGVWVEQLKGAVRVDNEGVFLSRLSGKIGRELHSGTVEGTLAWRHEGQLTGRMATSFDPRALMPVCKVFYPEAVGLLDRFSFPTTPPRMDFTFEAGVKPELSLTARGRIQASNYAYRGAVIGFATMNGEYALGGGINRMKLDPFSLTIGGRHAGGALDFDFISGLSAFEIESEVNLASVLRLAGLKEYLMAPWDFEEGARIVAKGKVGYSHPENSEVEARVEGARIGYKGVVFSNYSFAYNNRGYTHIFSDIRGNTGGGSVSGSAAVTSDKAGTHWTADVKAEIINADTDEFLKLVSTNLGWRVGGKTFGNLDVSGIGAVLRGQGQLTVREARIFKSPLAAGLLQEWGVLSRELDLTDVPAEIRFSFEANTNKISSRDVFLEVGGVGLAAQGSCGFDGSLEWSFKPILVNNQARGRALFSLFAPVRSGGYTLTGTMAKPEWHPVINRQKE